MTKTTISENTPYHRLATSVPHQKYNAEAKPDTMPISAPREVTLLTSIPIRKVPTRVPPKRLPIRMEASRMLPNFPPKEARSVVTAPNAAVLIRPAQVDVWREELCETRCARSPSQSSIAAFRFTGNTARDGSIVSEPLS
jgi:hypothetical protein